MTEYCIPLISLIVSVCAFFQSKKALSKTEEYNYNEFYRYVKEVSDFFEHVEEAFEKSSIDTFRRIIVKFEEKLNKISTIDKIPKSHIHFYDEITEYLNDLSPLSLALKIGDPDEAANIKKNNKKINKILVKIRKYIDKKNKYN